MRVEKKKHLPIDSIGHSHKQCGASPGTHPNLETNKHDINIQHKWHV